MSVYLCDEAKKYLEGLALSSQGSQGILIGHKRGHSYYIEQVCPYLRSLCLTDKEFSLLNEHFDDKIIGFYTFSSDKGKEEKILAPFAVGKIFLRVNKKRGNDLLTDSFLIDFDEKFILKKIQIQNRDKAE